MRAFENAFKGIKITNKDKKEGVQYSGILDKKIQAEANITTLKSEGGEKLLTGYSEDLKNNDKEKWEIIQNTLGSVQEVTTEDIENIPALKELTKEISKEANLKQHLVSSKMALILTTCLATSASFSGCASNGQSITPAGSIFDYILTRTMTGKNSQETKNAAWHAKDIFTKSVDEWSLSKDSKEIHKDTTEAEYTNCRAILDPIRRAACYDALDTRNANGKNPNGVYRNQNIHNTAPVYEAVQNNAEIGSPINGTYTSQSTITSSAENNTNLGTRIQ